MDKVKILFLFHMHQPMYRIREKGKNIYVMPWVYLHGVREYYDVARVIEEVEEAKITVNFVPTLLEQIEDYVSSSFEDTFLQHFKKDADSLTPSEKAFILKNFFSVNFHTKLKKSKRYMYLLDKRGSVYNIEKKVNRFTTNELRDLQVLFYLYNTSFYAEREFPEILELKRKGYGYSEEDKAVILEVHRTLLSKIVPLYKRLEEEGKIEITFTPYAHPISPLLIDSTCAKVSNPYTSLPQTKWSFPENVERQIILGMEYMVSHFGRKPQGMWPAEGGVSEEFIRLAGRWGVKWMGTDEGILEKSLGYIIRNREFPEEIYKVYEFEGVKIVFRDRELSDNIGFDLYKVDTRVAVESFVDKVRRIAVNKGNVLSVILDGENPWDNYENGGVTFLKRLFTTLSASGLVDFVSGSDLLDQNGVKLRGIHPGSWIRSDFTTWIGHPEKNRAWEYLVRVKNDVKDKIRKGSIAEKELIYAEGSDWFWWYGDDNPTFFGETFDLLFREHLKGIYRDLKEPIPLFLNVPVLMEEGKSYVIENESDFISPLLDGKVTNFFEWLGAGVIDLTKGQGGVMQRGSSLLWRLFFGRDEHNLYLRIEGKEPLEKMDGLLKLEFFDRDGHVIFSVKEGEYKNCVREKVFECSVPLAKVMLDGRVVLLAINLMGEEALIARFPLSGYFTLHLISPEDIAEDWIV